MAETEKTSEEQAIELLKIGFRQSNAGDIISFRIHPDNRNCYAALAKLNTRFGAVIVELKEDGAS